MTRNEFVALARTGGYSDTRTINAFVKNRDVFSPEDLVALHRLFVVSLGLRNPLKRSLGNGGYTTKRYY